MKQSEERSRDNWLAGDEWAALWDAFKHSAFRLETLPEYRVESERGQLELFLAGAPKPAGHNSDWHQTVRDYRTVGKAVQRVRTVRSPLTDYERMEFTWGYPGNSEAGEEIRVLDLSQVANPGLPDYDFWMFDDSTVIRMHYTEDGVYLGPERLTGSATEHVRYKELAIAHSMPLEEYKAG